MSARDIYPNELLKLAKELVEPVGPGRPRSVRLRRGVSTAYYALFHRLSRDVAFQALGAYGTAEAHLLVRWIGHHDLLQLAKEVTGQTAKLRPVLGPPSDRLTSVCDAFVRLQVAREAADYKHDYSLTKADARSLVRQAERAVGSTVRMRKSGDASYERFLRLAVGAVKLYKPRS